MEIDWVSVEDELPQSGELLLLAFNHSNGENDVTVGEYWTSDNSWHSGLFENVTHMKVTHWMYIPKHPKEI